MIIDVHTHVFPDKIAARAVAALAEASNITPVSNGTAADTLRLMDRAGVDKSVLVSVATKPSQMRTINDFLHSLESERFVPFGAIYPTLDDNEHSILEETERISKLGLKGIKLHPEYQNFYPDEEKLYPFYNLCSQLGLPILFHAGDDLGFKPPYHGTPERFASLAKKHPNLKIICAHFGGWRMWDEVAEILSEYKNIYYDTAFCSKSLSREGAERLINKKGVDNIMLGSDIPWEDPKDSIEFIDSLRISDSAKESILGVNAARIFEIYSQL